MKNTLDKKLLLKYGVLGALLIPSVSFAAVLATVNGKQITDAELNALISNLPHSQQMSIQKNPEAKKQLVDNLVDQELLLQAAVGKKLDKSTEYRNALNNFRRSALVNVLVSKELAPKVTDSAVKAYFNKHKLKYSGDEVRAQHILLPSEKEANSVMEQVKKGGDFQKLAEKYSKDPSAKNNRGDLGFFGRGQFDEDFTQAAFSTKEGKVVGPIKTTFGYHIIKVVDRKVGKPAEFTEVEQSVRADLQREVLENYVSDLKKKAKVKM